MSTRPFVATLMRRGLPVSARHYASLDNSVVKGTRMARQLAKPRDVVVISHAVIGLTLGEIKFRLVKNRAQLETWFVWEDDA